MPLETLKHCGKTIYRDIPAGALKIVPKSGVGVAYIVKNWGPRSVTLAKLFVGNSGKPALFATFKNESRAFEHIAEMFTNIEQHKQSVTRRRAESNAGHSLKVGDVITNSWGYDQTNVDWYVITRTSHNFVWLREICADMTATTSHDSGREMPRIGEDGNYVIPEKSKETKHKASGQSCTMKFGCGSLWDGRALHSSWGH